MMTLAEIKVAASTLASNCRGRLTMPEAVAMMVTVQPHYADFWREAERSIHAGNPLSTCLPAVWPAALVAAVKAGEESANMEQVFAQISKASEIQQQLRKLLMKLLYPAAIGLAGVVLFFFTMLFVAPNTARSFRAQDANAITQLALSMEALFVPYWPAVLAALVVSLAFGLKWAASTEGKAALSAIGLALPYLGPGLREMYFGIWAHYMAMLCAAGMSTDRAILLTLELMPLPLREGLLVFERDISRNNLALSTAANVASLSEADPRQLWPLFVRRAFIVGDRTGDLAGELQRIAPELIALGVEKISLAIEFGNIAATIIAGVLAASSFVGIYAPIIGAVKTFH